MTRTNEELGRDAIRILDRYLRGDIDALGADTIALLREHRELNETWCVEAAWADGKGWDVVDSKLTRDEALKVAYDYSKSIESYVNYRIYRIAKET